MQSSTNKYKDTKHHCFLLLRAICGKLNGKKSPMIRATGN